MTEQERGPSTMSNLDGPQGRNGEKLPVNFIDQLERRWQEAAPGTGNPNHDEAWERWADLTHRAFPALIAAARFMERLAAVDDSKHTRWDSGPYCVQCPDIDGVLAEARATLAGDRAP